MKIYYCIFKTIKIYINKYKKSIFLTLLFYILIFSFINEKNKKFICLCVIGKKENLYAKEYINHYKKLGYDHIFIYDNNDVNDERFSDILNKEIQNGFVSIIDYFGYKGKSNSIQIEAYFLFKLYNNDIL